jgi:hypothetical protein
MIFAGLSAIFLPAPASAQSLAWEVIAAVNALRASYGLPPYSVDPGLMSMAQEHSNYQAAIHKSTHQHSNGLGPPDLGVIENVAGYSSGYGNAQVVVYEIWADPGHLHTMIGYPAGAMGVGVADDGETTYFTLEVRPAGAAFSSPQAAGTAQAQYTPIALVALATVTPRADGSLLHPVGYGQTLWTIAEAYGVTIEQLRAWNNLDPEASEIYAGQMLLVRPAGMATPASAVIAENPVEATPSATSLPQPTASPPPAPMLTPTTSPAIEGEDTPPTATTLPGEKSSSGILLPLIGGLFILGGLLLAFAARARRR